MRSGQEALFSLPLLAAELTLYDRREHTLNSVPAALIILTAAALPWLRGGGNLLFFQTLGTLGIVMGISSGERREKPALSTFTAPPQKKRSLHKIFGPPTEHALFTPVYFSSQRKSVSPPRSVSGRRPWLLLSALLFLAPLSTVWNDPVVLPQVSQLAQHLDFQENLLQYRNGDWDDKIGASEFIREGRGIREVSGQTTVPELDKYGRDYAYSPLLKSRGAVPYWEQKNKIDKYILFAIMLLFYVYLYHFVPFRVKGSAKNPIMPNKRGQKVA